MFLHVASLSPIQRANEFMTTQVQLTIFPPVEESRLSQIKKVSQNIRISNSHDLPAAMESITDADAFFGKMTLELLQRAKTLRWVQSPTASLEHFLFPELIEHPCVLTNMRGLFSDVIADHVMGIVLCFARNLHTYVRRQMAAQWAPVGGESERTTFTSGPAHTTVIDHKHKSLSDCSLGVVGAGQIGQEVLRRARAFGMQVMAVDPLCRSIPGVLDEVWPTSDLNLLLADSDYVIIAAPHTPATFKLFRAAQFETMKRSAVLINIGRGAIVDLRDLTDALQNGIIGGAGLDVFEIEPLPSDHPLWRMDNVIITPHIAGASPRIAERHLATLLENVRRFTAGEELLNIVDKRSWF